MKADLHIHTASSPDCNMSPEEIIEHCHRVGIDCIAITDHNHIGGALEVQQKAPFPVIVGEEIRTRRGEVIGLFLTEEIPPGLSPEETVARIKEQGGLVCIPHPFDRIRRRSTLRRPYLERLLPHIDILEAFNSRTTLVRDSTRARLFAQEHSLLLSAGSDAHAPYEIGGAYMVMPEFDGVEGFRLSLEQGEVVGRRASLWVHVATAGTKLTRLLDRIRAKAG